MASLNREQRVFDPKDVTAKINFSREPDYSSIQGQNVLITGGANGLGAAITRSLCEKGATVTIADLNVDEGKKLAADMSEKHSRAFFVETDVTSWASQVHAFKTAIGNSDRQGVDMVIPCAGLPGIALPLQTTVSLHEDPPEPSTSTIDVTLTGVYYTTVLAIHYFRLPSPVENKHTKGPKKQIIFIGSLASYIDVPPIADYNAAKFGVRGMWKSIRREIRDMGIRSNMIAPTFLPTVMLQQVVPKLEERGAKIGKIEDVVDAALRIASSDHIDCRAVAVGGNGNFDLRDDYEGLDGGIETLEYLKSGAFGGGMHTFKDVLAGRTWT